MLITISNRQNLIKIDRRTIRRDLKLLVQKLDCEDKAVGLLLVDDLEIQKLNNTYLNRDKATNVLSFAMGEGEFGNINPHILGDIVISAETAYRDALRSGIDFRDELGFLVIHGLLHLRGYDHEQTPPKEARLMKERERELFFLLRGYHLERR